MLYIVPTGCLYNCSGTLREELTITCNVNGREDTQSSISYQVNGGALVNGRCDYYDFIKARARGLTFVYLCTS